MLVYMRNFGFLMDKPFLSDSFVEAHTLTKIIDEEVYAAAIIQRLKAMGISYIMFNYKFVFGETSTLNTGEQGIFKNFLIRHGKRISRKNEFFLYSFMLDSEPGEDLISIPLNHSASQPGE